MSKRWSLGIISIAFAAILSLPFIEFSPAQNVANNEAESKLKKSKLTEDEEYYELFKTLADTIDQVERNYVKDISRRELMEAAIEGILKKLDPYSSYISPDEIERFNASLESKFGGLGIQVSAEFGQLKIISPLVGTPAYRAGLQAGDLIVKIKGKSTKDYTLNQAIQKMKGEIGTSVKISIMRFGWEKEKQFEITRELIRVQTILGNTRTKDDQWDYIFDAKKKIGYIRITAFSRDTAKGLRKALQKLRKQNMKGLILDLRFNPGGLLSSAIEICDMFIDKGRIVSTRGRNVRERVWDAHREKTYNNFPMVVLVNHYSASASEIVSACLQDHQRAIVVGERTWGKGSVQNVIQLEGGKSALKLTTASYWRPSGKNIHRFPNAKKTDDWGVTPRQSNIVKLTGSEMQRLIRVRREKDIILPHSNGPKAPEPNDDTSSNFVDRQLQKALQYIDQQFEKKK